MTAAKAQPKPTPPRTAAQRPNYSFSRMGRSRGRPSLFTWRCAYPGCDLLPSNKMKWSAAPERGVLRVCVKHRGWAVGQLLSGGHDDEIPREPGMAE